MLKITFFSNYLTHHQIPVANELYKRINNNFTFVACQPMENERKEQGWNLESAYPYELKAYGSDENREKAIELARSSDVVIFGAAPRQYLIERLKERKLTFRYTERYFKKTRWEILNPRVLRNKLLYDFRYRNKKYLHVLSAGAYAADDCRFILSYPGRIHKWGYFTESTSLSLSELNNIKSNAKKEKILWVARFIDWKHPMIAIKIAEALVDKGINFELTMIGEGPLKHKCEKYVADKCLQSYVVFTGTCNREKVKKYMSEASIFLHTADRNEGWGAVINESMSNACATVVNKKVGAASYLIKNNYNGFTTDGSICNYVNCIERLILDSNLKENIAREAYNTVQKIWSPTNASKNLIDLIEKLLQGKENDLNEGPCSKA